MLIRDSNDHSTLDNVQLIICFYVLAMFVWYYIFAEKFNANITNDAQKLHLKEKSWFQSLF